MNGSGFLMILRARWVSAAAVFLAVIVTTAAASLLLPKRYTATASVLLDMRPDPIAGIALVHPNTTNMAYLTTQADLLTSERVSRKVIKALALEQNEALRVDWQEDTNGLAQFEPWLAANLVKTLAVKPSRDSSVLTISYASRDPNFSAAVVNAYVKAYIETVLELKTEPARQFSSYFDERAKKFRAEVEAAQARLAEFQRSKGIVGGDERLDIETMRLNELSSQVVAMEAVVAEAGSRAGQAGATPDRMQEVLNNPVVATLQSDLSRQEARLEETRSRLGDANPQVIEARSAIAGLRAKLQAAVQQASGSVSVTSNVASQRLAQLRASRDEQRAKVLRLKDSRDEMTVLQRDVDNAQRAFDAVVARGNQFGIESQASQTNVSVVKDASPPAEHSTPNLPLNLALAVLLGSLLAVATALMRERLDPRLRSAGDITQVLQQPLLVVMPRPAESGRRISTSSSVLNQRLTGSRSAGALSAG